MLAVLSLAATSRSCSALAIAGPSFSAVARGVPSMGAIVTLALSFSANIGDPLRGTSSAKGRGKGWQPAIHKAAVTAAAPTVAWKAAVRRRQIQSDNALCARHSRFGCSRSALERNCREATAVHAFATQAAAPITEKAFLLGRRIVSGARDHCDTRPNQPALNIARQIEHEMPSPRGRRED